MFYFLSNSIYVILFAYPLGLPLVLYYFFFNDPATTEIYTLSLHDALPISCLATSRVASKSSSEEIGNPASMTSTWRRADRKSTRLNSSHVAISYAVFCLKKKKKHDIVWSLTPRAGILKMRYEGRKTRTVRP